eukprot:Platyproteum_vivax@DN1414_c0_g1_i1.p1
MPLLQIITNCKPAADAEKALLKELSKACAKLLSKPEGFVMCSISAGQTMSFGGEFGPTAFASLKSVGLAASSAEIKTMTKELTDIITKGLNVAGDRVFLEVGGVPGTHFAWNGSPFA